jgi:hypothetical protein
MFLEEHYSYEFIIEVSVVEVLDFVTIDIDPCSLPLPKTSFNLARLILFSIFKEASDCLSV